MQARQRHRRTLVVAGEPAEARPRERIAPHADARPWMGASPPVKTLRVYAGRDDRTVLHACSQRRHASMHVWQWA